jgi:hypothetical protein
MRGEKIDGGTVWFEVIDGDRRRLKRVRLRICEPGTVNRPKEGGAHVGDPEA